MTVGVNAHAEHDDRPDWERTIAIKRQMPSTARENGVVPFVVMSPDKQIAAIDKMGYGLAEWAIVSLGPAKRWSFAITNAVLWTQRQRSK